MRLLTRGLIIVGVIMLMSSPLTLLTAHMQNSHAWEILGLLNNTRIAGGIPPLAMNSRLVAASQRHSDDMADGDFLSHTGSDGSEFWIRMTDAGYNMSAGAENVQYRWDASPSGVFQQWRDSPPHYANMMSPAYQEVGITYAVAASGKYYFTMVLAARPDFVPSTSASLTDTILPSIITSVPPPDNAVTPTQMSVQSATTSLPDASLPLTNTPEAPTSVFAPPSVVPPATATATPVSPAIVQPSDFAPGQPPTASLAEPTAVLPHTAPGDNPVPAYVILDTGEDPIQPRRSLREIIPHLLGQNAIEIISPSPTLPPESVITPPPQPPTPTLIPHTPTELMIADLRLEYTDESFTIINMGGGPVYIEGLWFESRSGALRIDRWDTEYLSAPLDYFPNKGCLQAWGFEVDAVLSPPESCQIRHGWVVVNDDQQFWRNAEFFTVHRYDEAVTVCVLGLGSCDVNLSDRLMVYPTLNPPPIAVIDSVSPPHNTPAGGTADVRLVYSPESFTILNISGTVLDLTGLGFSSSSGTVSISRWDTEFLSRPLYAFPSGDCLQAWPLTASEWPVKPGQCNLRHAWIAVNGIYAFWVATDYFTVSRNGVVLGTCSVNAGQCEVSLQ